MAARSLMHFVIEFSAFPVELVNGHPKLWGRVQGPGEGFVLHRLLPWVARGHRHGYQCLDAGTYPHEERYDLQRCCHPLRHGFRQSLTPESSFSTPTMASSPARSCHPSRPSDKTLQKHNYCIVQARIRDGQKMASQLTTGHPAKIP